MSSLESRYKRLLALYPAAHRHRYQEEMLGTLMDGANEGQRSPRPSEILDLLGNALRMRLARGSRIRGADRHWQTAASVFGFVGAALLAALVVAEPLGLYAVLARDIRPGASYEAVQWQVLAIAVIWGAAALAALLPARAPAALIAWLATLGYIAWHFTNGLTEQWPMVVLSVLTAACLTRLSSPPIQRVVGRVLVILCGLAAVSVGSALWVDVWLRPDEPYDRGTNVFLPGSLVAVGFYPIVIYSLCLVLMAVLLANVTRPVRRRVIALALVPFVMHMVVRLFYGQRVGIDTYFIPVVPTAAEWLPLILLPPVMLAAAALFFRLREGKVGESAEQHR